jgi:hypothetical protein
MKELNEFSIYLLIKEIEKVINRNHNFTFSTLLNKFIRNHLIDESKVPG